MRFAELSMAQLVNKGDKRSHGLESISWDILWSSVRGGKMSFYYCNGYSRITFYWLYTFKYMYIFLCFIPQVGRANNNNM